MQIKEQIKEVLKEVKKEKPITGKQIIRQLEIKEDPRKFGAKLRNLINQLRNDGFPVCASGKGYYYPQNLAELKDYLDKFKGRIMKQHEAYNGMLNTYQGKFDQAKNNK